MGIAREPSVNQMPMSVLLPTFCQRDAVLRICVLAQVVAILLALVPGLELDFWLRLGVMTLMVQWICVSMLSLLWLSKRHVVHWSAWALRLRFSLALLLVVIAVGTLAYRPLQMLNWPGVEHYEAFLLQLIGISLLVSFLLIQLASLYAEQRLRLDAQARAEADALQARIRPHFLFNTLNMLAELTQQDPSKAEQAILDLAKLFRAALQSHSLVSLTDEFALARKYIALEQLRLGERLQLQWHVPESLPMLQIPGLTLQPLLENAVRYGIEPSQQPALLTVLVEVGRSQCSVTIRNQIWPNVEHGKGNGIALQNIKHRLQLFYGDAAALTVHQQQGQFITKLTLPLTKDAH